MNNIKEGGVLIKYKSKQEQDVIKKAAEKKLSNNYEIKVPSLKNPCIKIVDIEEQLNSVDLLNLISRQNLCILHGNTRLHVKVIKKMKTKFMAIVAMQNGILLIGLHVLFEYVNVPRSFIRGNFDHYAIYCKLADKCLKCTASDHVTENCPGNNLTYLR